MVLSLATDNLSLSRGKFGEKIFTLGGTYIRGQSPKSVNFYWRRFRLDDIPLDSAEDFDVWLRERWYEKDAFMDQYISTGRFPASPAHAVTKGQGPYLETEVRTRYPWEFLQIFSVLGAFALVVNFLVKTWNRFLSVWS
jgi:hypothetical protein